ncbi:MAG: membrane dipeptidase [Armatimonas sp.]
MKTIPIFTLALTLGLLTSGAQAQDPPQRIKLDPGTLKQVPGIIKAPPRLRVPLWGWADLHAHPASHLSFGADAAGNNGIFWGKPGMSLAAASPASIIADLPPCAPDKHGGFDGDVVRHKTHQTVIGTIDNITGFGHQSTGAPLFTNWPNALSLTHQMMHITSIRRAYDGGQRLMIASVTDNEFLSALWSKIGYNALGNKVPLHDPQQGYNSAKRQLDFIQQMAAANPSWMEIANSAADARRIIASNKMALILSLEMDSLTPDQILTLVRDEHVRHVIPIHLINNTMGGCAVYTDAFNTANAFVNSTRQSGNWNNLGNDGFFKVRYDTKLSGRLNRPQTLVAEGNNLIQGGAIWPREVDDAVWATLGYDAPLDRGGHKNMQGLTPQGTTLIRNLAQKGILIDIAHMGEASASAAMLFAVFNKYPVMDSHTGLRAADETATNERALMREHARMIANLGGVIGLGTEGTSGMMPIIMQPAIPTPGKELVRFTLGLVDRSWQVTRIPGNPVITNLTVTIKTGGDDLRGGNNWVKAWVTIRGARREFDLSKGQGWPNGSVRTVSFPLPAGTRSNDIDRFTLHTNPDGKNGIFDSPDNWNVDELKVSATLASMDTIGTWLKDYQDALSLMQGRGMAIGTDINGFAPQFSFSADTITYPLTVAQNVGIKPSGYTPPALPRSQMGPRQFDFKRDGIAHYGMLADFMQAVSQKPGSGPAMTALFRSANDVVEMWEKCEAAAKDVK